MWLCVFFDLPVGTKRERKAATRFRLDLLDLGFEMTQFSVYLRFCAGKEQAESYERKIEQAMPSAGNNSWRIFAAICVCNAIRSCAGAVTLLCHKSLFPST